MKRNNIIISVVIVVIVLAAGVRLGSGWAKKRVIAKRRAAWSTRLAAEPMAHAQYLNLSGEGMIEIAAISPDGRRLLSGGRYGKTVTLKIWDLDRLVETHVTQFSRAVAEPILHASFVGAGHDILMLYRDGVLEQRDAESLAVVKTFHSPGAVSFARSAMAGELWLHGANLWLPRKETPGRENELPFLHAPIDAIGLSARGTSLGWVRADGNRLRLMLWERGGRKVKELDLGPSGGEGASIALSDDDKRVAVGSADGGVRIIERGPLHLAATVEKPATAPDGVPLLQFHPRDSWLVAARGRRVELWPVGKNQPLSQELYFPVRWLLASADGRRIVLGGDYSVVVWEQPWTSLRGALVSSTTSRYVEQAANTISNHP